MAQSPTGNRFVEIFRLAKAYPNPFGDDVVVVEDFNLILRRGEIVSLIGHSGCGKSTVLTMLAGLNEMTNGSIAVAAREISGPGPDRAVVFQSPCLLPWMTAVENVQLGVDRIYLHASQSQRRELCEYYLALVGLGASFHNYPREMSGGMQQRVGIARAIALRPDVLLLDEPFGRLDSLTRMELQEVILGILDRERITTMLVTHDVDEALFMSDRICMMTNGPKARVGQILELPLGRPRDRAETFRHSLYYDLRGCLVDFLERQELGKPRVDQAVVDRPIANGAMDKTQSPTQINQEPHPSELISS